MVLKEDRKFGWTKVLIKEVPVSIVRLYLLISLLLAFCAISCTTAKLAAGDKFMELETLKLTKTLPKINSARFDSVHEQCQTNLLMAHQLLEQIITLPGKRDLQNTLLPYNEIQVQIDSAMSLAGLLSQVHPDKAIRDRSDSCEQQINRFVTDLSLNRALFQALSEVSTENLDDEASRMLQKTLQDFKRSGVDKSAEIRDQIRKLEEELVLTGQDFGRNIREDVRYIEVDPEKSLVGLPEDYVAAHKIEANGKVKITTDYPDYIPFMTYANDAEARKELWKKSNSRGYPANKLVLSKMLNQRYELAKLLGYESYADYVVEDKMIKSSVKAEQFIDQIADIAKVGADKEYKILLKEKNKTLPNAKNIQSYERAFLDEKVKRANYNLDSKEVRAYFPFDNVRDGLLNLTSKLFKLSYIKDANAPVWHHDVEVYDVFDENNLIGRIYLDLHPRENKYKHAAQFTLKSGLKSRQIPEGVLVCNFPQNSADGKAALMDHDQVVTFFHEFGHLLHHVLGGQQNWIRFSGVATEWDFVEAPSQFFEEWAWDPEVLAQFSSHNKTGKPIPKELVAKMRNADEFGKGIDTMQQMFYAAMSLQYYKQNPADFDADELMKSLQAKYSKFPFVANSHFNLNFGHLEGYSAMYYTYMWSKVIAKDLLSPFKKEGMLNVEQAIKYRQTVLEKGGSKDASELVEGFLGRHYQFESFREWLEAKL